ncbi:carbohydrate ABC transporter permease [Microbacterium terricola]|uniref:Sugar ABC transporter permease n=1 Tax=Microbacterium terricola TaxID=344163 RepID=A0ABM8DWG0_9MICO|nr:sugar ABC transporter permease [Microbacterium terricola]UYK39342.1 sugar ABC transporter permease [Microbacterium terricola]BDV29935.1 sugar ABC transporter permease [Microbacterium terricola]
MALTTAPTLEGGPRVDESVGARRRRVPTAPYLLLTAAVAILLFGMGYPVYWQIVTSFQKYGAMQQLGGKAPDWVGLQNYIDIATDPTFWQVAVRSLAFCVVTAAVTVVIGMLMALLMTKVPAAVRLILQLALLIAWAMPVVAAMTVWIWLFDRRRGVVNYLLSMIPGVDMHGFNWIGSSPALFFVVASVIVIWMSVPFVAFSAYAGLTQVSEEVMEASQLDGAGGWDRLRYIILPMIRPVIMIVLLLNLIWDLRVFAQITMLQDAGPQSTDYDLLGTYIYKNGVAGLDFGHGAAMSIFVLALTIAVSWFYIRSLLKEDKA